MAGGGADLKFLARGLAAVVEGEVRFGLHDRMLYATDASLYQVEPLGVVIPASVDDAVRAVRFCAENSLPVLPRGGGTSLAGQCTNRAVVLDFSARCGAIRGIDAADPSNASCEVEPGITVEELNDRLAPRRVFFAPDPATARQANIGGCIGNNAAGARSIMYGRTSENLLGVEACLADGAVVRFEAGAATRGERVRELTLRVAEIVTRHAALIRERFPKTIRRNAGYSLDLILQQMDSAGPRADSDAVLSAINLSHLLCGSEGTLAVTLAARLKLRPLPEARGLALIGFTSLDEAVETVGPILRTSPSAVELLDDLILDLASANPEYRRYVELMPRPAGGPLRAVLYVEYSQFAGKRSLGGAYDELRGTIGDRGGRALLKPLGDAAEVLGAWKLRKAGEPLLHGMPGDRKPITFVEDNAVPVERLPEFVRRFREIVARHGTRASFWAHASVGVLHVRPLLNIRDAADRERILAIATEVADLAKSLGGVMSGEHGDGKARGPLLERYFGPELMRAFREVKAVFDPRNLLNPGNMVEPGPVASIVERTRVNPAGVETRVPAADTYFDFSDQHGLRGAVEMCNGAGVCRKKTGGTMCPSYMGTLDERHSTRGRGNALRLAITGQFRTPGPAPVAGASETAPAWNDAETLATLDLCLSCKACKAECPSNVDIARLKAEYLAQGYKAGGGAPLKSRAFGNVRLLNRLGSITPRAANWVNRLGFVKAMIERTLGVDRRRSIPEFARPLSAPEVARSSDHGAEGSRTPRVVLFGDCFTMYNEPGIGMAAARVLGAFGYPVELIDAGCCGRSMISMGMLENAIAGADASLARLSGAIDNESVRAVVVCEPSCLSAIKDDWLQLKLRTPIARRKALASKAWLVEEFLDRFWESHPRRPPVSTSAGDGPVLLHGHCHQKALWGAESSANLLRRVVGGRLQVLDTGCCGMAGSFGYAAEKYDLSMKIGELALFPAVRGAPGATVTAPGTSCRHQIRDGTGVRSLHPVELVDRLLAR